MSNQIDNGGSAFPHSRLGSDADGMSLRDWFAGMALQGQTHRLCNPHEYRELMAKDCYEIADAMLAARKEGSK
jgi:hypothetical protein